MHRRTLLRGGMALSLASVIDGWLARPAWAKAQSAGQAEHLIVLWMNGGASHLETWDPKEGKNGTRHKIISTRSKGLRVAEHMPRLAAMADRFSVLRGVQSKEGNHQRAQYLMHTGYAPNPTVEHPSIGGWLSKLGAPMSNGLPAFVSIGGASLSAGFLGVEHGPFVLPKAASIPPNTAPQAGVSAEREQARLQLLAQLDGEFLARTGGDPKVSGRRELLDKAVAMTRTPQLAAFDLSKESAATRSAFGDSDFARGCLAALRLVDAGVRCVEVALDGWDTHKDVAGGTAKLMKILDPAMSSLLRELTARGLYDKTLVVWMSDFGRTPKINGNEGRDHHPQASSVVLAGGGVRPGVVHGATDAEGAKVVEGAVSVPDLMATLCARLSVDYAKMVPTPIGRPIGVTDHGTPIGALLGG